MRTMSQQEGGRQRSARAPGKVTCRTGRDGITLQRCAHTHTHIHSFSLSLTHIHTHTHKAQTDGQMVHRSVCRSICGLFLSFPKRWWYWFSGVWLKVLVCLTDAYLTMQHITCLTVAACRVRFFSSVEKNLQKFTTQKFHGDHYLKNALFSSAKTVILRLWIAISSILLL